MSKLATLDLMALFYFVITIEINANNNLSLTKITFQVFQFTTLVKDVEIWNLDFLMKLFHQRIHQKSF